MFKLIKEPERPCLGVLPALMFDNSDLPAAWSINIRNEFSVVVSRDGIAEIPEPLTMNSLVIMSPSIFWMMNFPPGIKITMFGTGPQNPGKDIFGRRLVSVSL